MVIIKDYIGALKRPTDEEYKNGLSWAKISLFRTAYPVIECADLMASETMEWIVKKKDIDNALVLKNAKWAREEVAKAVTAAQEGCLKDFVEEYAARIEDKIYPDILKLRNQLSIYLHRNKCSAAPTLCRLHTVETLLNLALWVYDKNDEYIFNHTGYHYVRAFPQFNPKRASRQWNQLCDIIYKYSNPEDREINLNNDKKSVHMVEVLIDKLYESDLIDDITNQLVKEYDNDK